MSRKLMQRTGFASLVMEAFSVMKTMMLTVSGCNAQAVKVSHTSVALACSLFSFESDEDEEYLCPECIFTEPN